MNNLMLGAVLHAPGNLKVEKVSVPQISPDQVLVHVKAAGICGSDLDRVMKTGTYHFPTIPGHEFCGEIAAIGDNVISDFKIGDRVLAAPIIPCYKCASCQEGNYGQCDNYNYLGSRTDGGFAEYVAVPSENIIPLPDSVSFQEGAAVEPAAVALHGIMRIQFRPGDCAVVLGCGAIGLFTIQFAQIMGATEIIAVDIDDEKLAFAKAAGATKLINGIQYHTVEEVLILTSGKGSDIVIETAGTSITQVQSIQLCKKHGQVLYLGTAHKDIVIPPNIFEHIVRNEIHITGSWNSYSAPFPGREWIAVLQFLETGVLKIAPFITHTFPLEQAPEVIKKMADKEFTYNKVVLNIDSK